ncbi:MAG TPA: hypothetical protein VGF14_07615 [Alphaproteobacteria bacterium]
MKFSYKTILGGMMALGSMIGCKTNPDLPPVVQKGTITGIAEKTGRDKGYYLTDNQGHVYDATISQNKDTGAKMILEEGRVNDTVYLLYQNRELCGTNGGDGIEKPVERFNVVVRELKKLPEGVKTFSQYPCN